MVSLDDNCDTDDIDDCVVRTSPAKVRPTAPGPGDPCPLNLTFSETEAQALALVTATNSAMTSVVSRPGD